MDHLAHLNRLQRDEKVTQELITVKRLRIQVLKLLIWENHTKSQELRKEIEEMRLLHLNGIKARMEQVSNLVKIHPEFKDSFIALVETGLKKEIECVLTSRSFKLLDHENTVIFSTQELKDLESEINILERTMSKLSKKICTAVSNIKSQIELLEGRLCR